MTQPQAWYPLADRDPHDDVGPFVDGAPERGVLHTTESPHFPTYKPGTHPHFTVWLDDAGKPHVAQHVPITHASAALVHASGQVDTNREGAIQIEVAWYAAKISSAPRPLLAATRQLMRWIESQTGILRQTVPFKAYPASYGANNGVRMSVAQWKTFRGWCGHQHVPENDHGDPGAIDIDWLLAEAAPRHNPHPRPDYARHPIDCRHNTTHKAEPVQWLQWELGIVADGIIGPATRAHLKAFQKAAHLTGDAVCGRATGDALLKRRR